MASSALSKQRTAALWPIPRGVPADDVESLPHLAREELVPEGQRLRAGRAGTARLIAPSCGRVVWGMCVTRAYGLVGRLASPLSRAPQVAGDAPHHCAR